MKKSIIILFSIFLLQYIYPTENLKDQYDEIDGSIGNELAAVRKGKKWGIVDKNGKQLTPFKYSNIEKFDDNFVLVNINTFKNPYDENYYKGMWIGKYGLVDKSGREITPIKYSIISEFKNGLAAVNIGLRRQYFATHVEKYMGTEGGTWGFIDERGKEVIPLIYDDTEGFEDELAPVLYKNKIGFIDKSGKEIIPCIYDPSWKYSYHRFSEGAVKLELNGKWGFVDREGKNIVPFVYDYVASFSEGVASVELDGKLGFVDKKGEVVIPIIYGTTYMTYFDEGLAAVELDGKIGFIDKNGDTAIPFIYDVIRDKYQKVNYFFHDGKVRVVLNGEWGYIDKKGNFTPKF